MLILKICLTIIGVGVVLMALGTFLEDAFDYDFIEMVIGLAIFFTLVACFILIGLCILAIWVTA